MALALEALTGGKQYFLVNLAARDADALLFVSAQTTATAGAAALNGDYLPVTTNRFVT